MEYRFECGCIFEDNVATKLCPDATVENGYLFHRAPFQNWGITYSAVSEPEEWENLTRCPFPTN